VKIVSWTVFKQLKTEKVKVWVKKRKSIPSSASMAFALAPISLLSETKTGVNPIKNLDLKSPN